MNAIYFFLNTSNPLSTADICPSNDLTKILVYDQRASKGESSPIFSALFLGAIQADATFSQSAVTQKISHFSYKLPNSEGSWNP